MMNMQIACLTAPHTLEAVPSEYLHSEPFVIRAVSLGGHRAPALVLLLALAPRLGPLFPSYGQRGFGFPFLDYGRRRNIQGLAVYLPRLHQVLSTVFRRAQI